MELAWDSRKLDIQQATKLAQKWNKRLLEWQGPGSSARTVRLLKVLIQMRKEGYSYANIAETINDYLSLLLKKLFGVY